MRATRFGECDHNDDLIWDLLLTAYSTFSAIKDLAGDWKQDPRYEDSWYFVVEKPEKPEEK
jgi:hypothetical protein